MLFMTAIQTDLTTVPYKGTGPAMNDLLGGQVDFMCDQTTNTTGQIKSGKVKVYAVTTPKRVPSLPDVPTMQESGLANFDVAVWHGLYAPKGTPKPIDRQARRRRCRSRSRIRRSRSALPSSAPSRCRRTGRRRMRWASTSRRRSICGIQLSRRLAFMRTKSA